MTSSKWLKKLFNLNFKYRYVVVHRFAIIAPFFDNSVPICNNSAPICDNTGFPIYNDKKLPQFVINLPRFEIQKRLIIRFTFQMNVTFWPLGAIFPKNICI